MADLFSQIERQGGRGLETVSHLFLTEPCSPDMLPFRSGNEAESVNAREGLSPLSIILCPDGFVPQSAFLGCMLALCLAENNVSVGLIETTVRLPHTFFLSGGYDNLDAVFWEGDPGSPDFLNVVGRLRKTCDFVVVDGALPVFINILGLMGPAGRCLVPTTAHPDDLLKTYSTVKSVSERWAARVIDLVVIRRMPADNVVGAAVILEKMARTFLPCSIRMVGSLPMPAVVAASGNCLPFPSRRDLPEAATSAARDIACHLMQGSGSFLKKPGESHAEKRV